ncbi:MAG: CDP-alcohol phosphatidyltransferase family protein [Oscillospiraceae bacterium]|nr:CDP-alcohol phosphatidyltransferase family protein [Oscillospiraceae bacterium]
MKKQIPNILSVTRIPLALSLFFVRDIIWLFILIYFICITTDILDGFLSRHFHWESDFGAKVDGTADLIFIFTAMICAILMIKDRPQFNISEILPLKIIIAIAATIFYKFVNAVFGKIKFKKWCFIHNFGGKFVGGIAFCTIPLCLWLDRVPGFMIPLILIGTVLGLVDETLTLILSKDFEPDTLFFFLANKEKKEKHT